MHLVSISPASKECLADDILESLEEDLPPPTSSPAPRLFSDWCVKIPKVKLCPYGPCCFHCLILAPSHTLAATSESKVALRLLLIMVKHC